MPEVDLFSQPPIPGKRPTSQAAARDTAPKAASARLTVLRLIAGCKAGATRDELAQMGFPLQTICARTNELLNARGLKQWPPLIVESGSRVTRSGSKAAVLWLSEAGRDLLNEATR